MPEPLYQIWGVYWILAFKSWNYLQYLVEIMIIDTSF